MNVRRAAAWLSISAITFGACDAFGQARGSARRTAAPTGLSSLTDEAVYNELAARNMQRLLDHAFDVNKVPESQRQAALAIPAIKRLADEENPPKPYERAQLIQRISAGADRIVASENNPQTLMEHAAALIRYGVEPEVNLMEYWGETPKVQKRLAPVANAVDKMLKKAVDTSTAEREKAANELNRGRNTRAEEKWVEADGLVTLAEYTRAMVTYNKAMSIPAGEKGNEERKKLADEALAVLQNYDNKDSGVQTAIRNRMAKLNMVKRDYGPANDLFESVVSGQVDDKNKIEPPPGPFEQYEARYFGIVCEMMSGDTPRAQKGLEELIGWQKEAVKDPKAQEGLAAAAEMLRYRIAMKERDKAKGEKEKKAAEERAFGILLKLYNDRKDLRAIISEQLVDALGDDVEVKTQKVLILQAMMSKAEAARDAFDLKSPDADLVKQMQQGIAAAREVLDRAAKRNDPDVTPDVVRAAGRAVPVLYQAMGKRVEAASGYVDYIEKKYGTPDLIAGAFNEAGKLLLKLTNEPATKGDPKVWETWDRFLPIAIDQFKRRDFAFDYATRLRGKSPPKYADAIKYLRLVPADDRRMGYAKYLEMITLTDWLYAAGPDKKPLLKDQERAAKVQETIKVADEVRKVSGDALKREKDAKQQQALRTRIAVVTLTQAELAASGEKPDWAKVVAALDGFEQQAKGLPNESALMKKVMELRVAAYVQRRELVKATPILTKLLETEPGGRASGLVLGILQRLNEDYDRAKAAGDAEAAENILKSRAELSGYLVDWAKKSQDPKVAKNLYTYKVYDADTQRLYGSVLEGAERKSRLEKAMAAFKAMRSPQEIAAYQALIADRKKENPADKTDPNYPDPGVTLGMAMTSYDLADWKTAATELKRLIFAGKLGNRTRTDIDAKTGEAKIIPNDQYWEATYKYYDAVRQWLKAQPQDGDAQKELDAVKTMLRRDYVAAPEDAGGAKWHDGYEVLRKELIPDLNVEELKSGSTPPPQSQPAEPVASKR
jgi:hypothetical protein